MNTEIWQNWIFCWSPLMLAHYFVSCHFSPIFLTKGRLWRAPFIANPPPQAVLSSLLCCVTHHLRFFSLSLPTALHSVWVQMKRRCQLWALGTGSAMCVHEPLQFPFSPGILLLPWPRRCSEAIPDCQRQSSKCQWWGFILQGAWLPV